MFSSRYRGAELDLLGVAIIGIVGGFEWFDGARHLPLDRNRRLELKLVSRDRGSTAAVGGMLAWSLLHRIEMVINVLDALTIGIFGVIGTTRSSHVRATHRSALFIGVAAAVGGSILRDMLLALPMQLMQVGSLYAVAAGLGGVTVIVLLSMGQSVTVAASLESRSPRRSHAVGNLLAGNCQRSAEFRPSRP